MSALKVTLLKVGIKLRIFFLENLLRPLRPPHMVRLGTYYGGWWIPDDVTPPGTALCVGAGTDVTFDLELARLGFRVVTADPTPDSVAYLEQYRDVLEVRPVGVWTSTGEIEFAQDSTFAESWMIGGTATASVGTTGSQSFPVMTVKDLIADAGLDGAPLDILKLDIEGAEHDVLRSMLADGVLPRCLCVEFDDHRIRRVIASTRLLQRAGYTLLQVEGLNYIFTRA